MEPSTVIQGLVGLFWTAAYVEIAYRGLRDKTYGMPIAALFFNLSWEFYWSFIERPPGQEWLMSTAQLVVNVTWLLIDVLILISVLRYGPREFPALSPPAFYGLLAVTAVLTAVINVILTRDFDRKLIVPLVFGSNLMMSALFIAMLLNRGSCRGQSLTIAVNKMTGTVLASIGVLLYAPEGLFTDTVLLPALYVGTFVLDLIYMTLLWHTSEEPHEAGIVEAARHPPALPRQVDGELITYHGE